MEINEIGKNIEFGATWHFWNEKRNRSTKKSQKWGEKSSTNLKKEQRKSFGQKMKGVFVLKTSKTSWESKKSKFGFFSS